MFARITEKRWWRMERRKKCLTEVKDTHCVKSLGRRAERNRTFAATSGSPLCFVCGNSGGRNQQHVLTTACLDYSTYWLQHVLTTVGVDQQDYHTRQYMGMVNRAITQGKFWVWYTELSHKVNSGYDKQGCHKVIYGYGKQGYHTRQY